MPAARTASATPATSGASGPTTTRSDAELGGERGDGGAVHRVDVVQRGDRRHARVAGRRMHRVDAGIRGEGADQGVLPATGTRSRGRPRAPP